MLLVDFIDRSSPEANDDHGSKLRNVHLTLYDMTYRYDPDTKWIDQLTAIARNLAAPKEGNERDEPLVAATSQVTRIFFYLADCNFDYSSPLRYKSSERMILRIGDFRVSSNIVSPKPTIQAFSLAVGDATVYLCKIRYPYNFENSQLPRSSWLMRPSDISLELLSLNARPTAESVQKAMRFLTVATLESFDAVITLTNRQTGEISDPELLANLTIGDVCIFACKDSFYRFVEAIGELVTEFTCVDEEELLRLKSKSYASHDEDCSSEESVEDQDQSTSLFHPIEELTSNSSHQSSTGILASDPNEQFLLDGYDWTTVDQDEADTVGIPNGEEQAARWYGAPSVDNPFPNRAEEVAFLPSFCSPEIRCSAKPIGSRAPNIVSHHIPIAPVSCPLIDEDMGLARYAGTLSTPPVRSRILVHDLNLKIRLFDGYDWPELLENAHAHTASVGSFVIDEGGDLQTEKLQMAGEVADRLEDDVQIDALQRKAKLMGELLSDQKEADSLESIKIFESVPLPEERGAHLKEEADNRKLSRRTGKYVQFSVSGMSIRIDSLKECTDHRLASCMNIKAQDFFIAETISRDRPVKLVGEWVNEIEHPRDTKDGLMMMKVRARFSCLLIGRNAARFDLTLFSLYFSC